MLTKLRVKERRFIYSGQLRKLARCTQSYISERLVSKSQNADTSWKCYPVRDGSREHDWRHWNFGLTSVSKGNEKY